MKLTSIRSRATGAAAVALLLAGCQADRVTGLRAPAPARQLAATSQTTPACPFVIKSIDDRRVDKSLGMVINTKVDGDGFAEWFANGMAAVPGHSTGNASTALQIEVLKAYIQTIGGTFKSANLVVRVTATEASGKQRQTTFRGVDGSINWNSSENEVQVAFNDALADLQKQIGADLKQHCGS